MKKYLFLAVFALAIGSFNLIDPAVSSAESLPASAVSFVNLKDGDKVPPKFKVEMAVSGMKVAPAGTIDPGTGHHHIIIDGAAIESGQIVPADSNHLHFGKAQSEAELTLTPGRHTLTLQFADGLHRSFGKAMSKTIQIEVVELD